MKLSRIQNIQDRLARQDIQPWEWDGIVRELLRDVKVEYPLPMNQLRAGALHRVRTEGKIPAIKWWRNNTDSSLMEAKLAVEKLMEDNGLSGNPPRQTAQVRKTIGKKNPARMEAYQRQWDQPTKGKGKSKKKGKLRSKLRLRHRVPPKPKKKSKTA